jgi:hypothetical protein
MLNGLVVRDRRYHFLCIVLFIVRQEDRCLHERPIRNYISVIESDADASQRCRKC